MMSYLKYWRYSTLNDCRSVQYKYCRSRVRTWKISHSQLNLRWTRQRKRNGSGSVVYYSVQYRITYRYVRYSILLQFIGSTINSNIPGIPKWDQRKNLGELANDPILTTTGVFALCCLQEQNHRLPDVEYIWEFGWLSHTKDNDPSTKMSCDNW